MIRVYSVVCIQHQRLKGDEKTEPQQVERTVSKIVAVEGYAEDAIAKVKALVGDEPKQDDREITGLDIVYVTLMNEAE